MEGRGFYFFDARTDGLTVAQEAHLRTVAKAFVEAVTTKYVAGAKEHGGNIWDMSAEQLVDHAIEECIDQFVYLHTARAKLRGEI